ncbi:hypothetical protein LOK49_LG02G03896 [Camellia lanceoleosa]|uniref:Uncharacterized protein n=1 Tax=Camellia lanceoleosa TaxID=1840588 RepID=A0ACC0IM18_9ERIC|nr:hypothetical protein LOK49_LG02G03896 [Camellia lanceoleosa]
MLWWSVEFGAHRNGSLELHDMLAEYIYSESPEVDMTRVSYHFVRGKHPKTFASTLVNFMGKCYPGSKPKSKPKKEKTEEERKFRRRAKYFLVTQLVVVLVFLSLLRGSDDAEVELDDDDSLNYND